MGNYDEKKEEKSLIKGIAIFAIILIILIPLFTSGGIKSEKSNEYSINEAVITDSWKIEVLSVENTKILDYGGLSQKTTENNYLLVKMKLKNISDKPITPTKDETDLHLHYTTIQTRSIFELKSGNATYYSNQFLEQYVEDNYFALGNAINPNTEIIYTAVFETDKPSTESQYILEIDDNSFQNSKIYLYDRYENI